MKSYENLVVNQWDVDYRLLDLNGIPIVKNDLIIENTDIKSLRHLENHNLKGVFKLDRCDLHNLEYCPGASRFEIIDCPLFSYYGIKSTNISSFDKNLCGEFSYLDGKFNENQLNDVEFHAKQFCNFKFKQYKDDNTNNISINPWHNIHNDPSNVDNYEFLFVPFWSNSEMFREKAQEYLRITDLSGATRNREELW